MSAASRVVEALSAAGCSPRKVGNGWVARCPAHPDRTPSLSVGEGRNGRALLHCFASCSFDDILRALRLDLPSLPEDSSAPVPSAERTFPPQDEVDELWDRADAQLNERSRAWLRSRGIDVEAVIRLGLARSLRGRLPSWAWFKRRPWDDWHPLVVPLYDISGTMRSVQARRVMSSSTLPKTLFPTGHVCAGLLFADSRALRLLRAGAFPRAGMLVVEGLPDFLLTATWFEDVDEAPCVFGIPGGGGWPTAFADLVPTGAEVRIATHMDEAGERYARDVVASLRGRCRVSRSSIIEPNKATS